MDLLERPAHVLPRHPWEKARFRFFKKLLDPILNRDTPLNILDVGAGDGWMSGQLSQHLPPSSHIVCWDINYTPHIIEQIARHSPQAVTFVSQKPPGKFDILLLLDVLEHVPDDHTFLNLLVTENLVDNGLVLTSVPAWGYLFTNHDKHLNHHRRYHPNHCRSLLKTSDLNITQSGGLFHMLIIPRGVRKILELSLPNKRPTNKHTLEWRGTHIAECLVNLILRLDNALSYTFAKVKLQVPGLSWWALCTKQAASPKRRLGDALW